MDLQVSAVPGNAVELLALVRQQQSQVTAFLGSLGQGQSASADPFAATAGGAVPSMTDPKGDAIDYLLGSTGKGGAGDIFNLALSANGQGLQLAQVRGAIAAEAEAAYQQTAALFQLVEYARQANLDTLLQIGSGGSGRGLGALI